MKNSPSIDIKLSFGTIMERFGVASIYDYRGLQIIKTPSMFDTKIKVVERRFAERWFTLLYGHWRPFQREKNIQYRTPMQHGIRNGDKLYVHPDIAERIHAEISRINLEARRNKP